MSSSPLQLSHSRIMRIVLAKLHVHLWLQRKSVLQFFTFPPIHCLNYRHLSLLNREGTFTYRSNWSIRLPKFVVYMNANFAAPFIILRFTVKPSKIISILYLKDHKSISSATSDRLFISEYEKTDGPRKKVLARNSRRGSL